MGKKRKNKNTVMVTVISIIIIILIGIIAFTMYLKNGEAPLDSKNNKSINVVIPSGTSTGEIASILVENKIIDNTTVFRLKSKTKGYEGKYKAGEYALSPSMSMVEIMDSLIKGKTNAVRFTIPEGLDLEKISERLADQGIVNKDLFEEEVESGVFDYKFLKDAPAGPKRLEGYLYPETYDVFTTATEHDVIDRLLKQFDSMFEEKYYARAKELGLNINQVMTIASLIERETKVSSERKIVSSVIQNRISSGMPLQIDATVQYALGHQKERLTYNDLQVDSPYNTYKTKGLPPGPICSPSIESIEAALYPAKTDYIYYVLKPSLDGTHAFSNNYNQFLKDKNKYIKGAFGE